jgi:hypothetical protein
LSCYLRSLIELMITVSAPASSSFRGSLPHPTQPCVRFVFGVTALTPPLAEPFFGTLYCEAAKRAATASRASFLNNELRGSEHNPRNERERARIQQEMEDESGRGTLPITTQSPRSSATGPTPLLKLGGKVTAGCPKFKQRYLGGAARLAGARSIKCSTRATSRGRCK